MQVTSSRKKDAWCTTYTLAAVIEEQRYVAQHTIHDAAYDALNVKDKNDRVPALAATHAPP